MHSAVAAKLHEQAVIGMGLSPALRYAACRFI